MTVPGEPQRRAASSVFPSGLSLHRLLIPPRVHRSLPTMTPDHPGRQGQNARHQCRVSAHGSALTSFGVTSSSSFFSVPRSCAKPHLTYFTSKEGESIHTRSFGHVQCPVPQLTTKGFRFRIAKDCPMAQKIVTHTDGIAHNHMRDSQNLVFRFDLGALAEPSAGLHHPPGSTFSPAPGKDPDF